GGNAGLGGEFFGPHHSFLSRRSSSPIAAQRRHHEIRRIEERKMLWVTGAVVASLTVRPGLPSAPEISSAPGQLRLVPVRSGHFGHGQKPKLRIALDWRMSTVRILPMRRYPG